MDEEKSEISNGSEMITDDDQPIESHLSSDEEGGLNELLVGGKLTKSTTRSGIIYLSRIPDMMNVKKIRQIFSEFGEVGRIFLQPDERRSARTKNTFFTEGWIEFLDKRVAKRIAAALNNQRIGGKRRSRWYDELWNMKYLPKFQWAHLNERLAYERAVHKQRLRTEVSQVKREMTQFVNGVEKRRIQERLKQKKNKQQLRQQDGDKMISNNASTGDDAQPAVKKFKFMPRQTDAELTARKKKPQPGRADKSSAALDKDFLRGLFSGGGASASML